MKRWWLVIALLLSLGLNVGILLTLAVDRHATAGHPAWWGRGRPGMERPGPPGGERPGSPRLERLAGELGLQGEARERFVAIQRHFFEAAVAAHRRRMGLQRQLREELTAPAPDRQRVEKLVEALGENQLAFEKAFTASVLDTRELLDPEQERRYLRFLGRLRGVLGEGPPGGGLHGPPGRGVPPGTAPP